MKKIILLVLVAVALSGCTKDAGIINSDPSNSLAGSFETTQIPDEGLQKGGTYRNYEYKFEFAYPKNVILIDKDLNTNELPILQLVILKDYDLKEKADEDRAANEIVDQENEKLEETYGENNFMPTMRQGGEFVEINGNTFYSIQNAGEGFFGVGRHAYLQIGPDVLLLKYSAENEYFEKAAIKNKKDASWSYDSERKMLNNEFDNILQSFKFTND